MPFWENRAPQLAHGMLRRVAPYPQGTTLQYKGHELFKKPNQNENLKEARELKKEGPPLGRRKREKNERMEEKKTRKEEKGRKEK
jgi:hypothetical protein